MPTDELFYQLTMAELQEQLPGASDDQLEQAISAISDTLSERFAECCEDMRAVFGLPNPFDDEPDVRMPYANSWADTAAGPGSN